MSQSDEKPLSRNDTINFENTSAVKCFTNELSSVMAISMNKFDVIIFTTSITGAQNTVQYSHYSLHHWALNINTNKTKNNNDMYIY